MSSPQSLEQVKNFFAARAIAKSCTLDYLSDLEIHGRIGPMRLSCWDDLDIPQELEAGKEGYFISLALTEPKHQTGASASTAANEDALESFTTAIPDSPFDEIDRLQEVGKKIERLIDFIRSEYNIEFAERLADRIEALYQAAMEEEPDQIPISPESVTYFLAFLRELGTPNYPDIVLTPTHEIRARWHKASNRHFAVAFLASGDTRYVIFTPNPTGAERIDRLSGITTCDALFKTIEPHKVLDWVCR